MEPITLIDHRKRMYIVTTWEALRHATNLHRFEVQLASPDLLRAIGVLGESYQEGVLKRVAEPNILDW